MVPPVVICLGRRGGGGCAMKFILDAVLCGVRFTEEPTRSPGGSCVLLFCPGGQAATGK